MNTQFNADIERALLSLLTTHQSGATHFSKSWIEAVQRLSNHYVAEPDSISPWSEAWAREALLSYYHPLNQARALRVANKGMAVGFFQGIRHLIDLGCGSGAASLGFLLALNRSNERAGLRATLQCEPKLSLQIESLELCDHSPMIVELAKQIAEKSNLAPAKVTIRRQTLETYQAEALSPGTLMVLSYVLTESQAEKTLERLLKRNSSLEAIAILEPSTSQDARRLQALRPILADHGFNIWAPCTHTGACPLLSESDRDWCHDRVVPDLPSWWEQLEAGLPMKNKTVTVSYLLARKLPRKAPADEVRVIGDRLEEKTKVRQMICRGEHREFLSWFPSRLKAEAETFNLSRGDRFTTNEVIWTDARSSGKEFRLNLEAIKKIESSRLD